jgi:hypothetical protein
VFSFVTVLCPSDGMRKQDLSIPFLPLKRLFCNKIKENWQKVFSNQQKSLVLFAQQNYWPRQEQIYGHVKNINYANGRERGFLPFTVKKKKKLNKQYFTTSARLLLFFL